MNFAFPRLILLPFFCVLLFTSNAQPDKAEAGILKIMEEAPVPDRLHLQIIFRHSYHAIGGKEETIT